MSIDPFIGHFSERDAIAFQVVDSLDGDSARGDWVGDMGGAVRPLLQWSTDRESPRSLVGAARG
jgi:lipopolysaccharide transport system ATP-binding protein